MTDPVAAEGPLSNPFVGLAALLAASTAFQELVDADDAAEALTHIQYPTEDLTGDDPPVRPWALIEDDDLCNFEINGNLQGSGQLLLTIEADPDAELSERDNLVTFRNAVGAIVTQMLTTANTPKLDGTHYWNLVKASKLVTPALCRRRDHPTEFFAATFVMEWK